MGVPYHTLRVDHENRACIHAPLFVEDAVRLADNAVRPEIGQQREGQAAKLFGPRFKARHRICADLQYLHVLRFEIGVVLTEPADLVLSPAGKCKRQKRDYGFAAAKARQGERLRDVRRKRKIRRLRTCLKCSHYFLLVALGRSIGVSEDCSVIFEPRDRPKQPIGRRSDVPIAAAETYSIAERE